MSRTDRRLVRVQIDHPSPQTDHGQRIPHHLFAVKRPQHLSAGKRRHNEHRHRLDLQVGLAPYFALQSDARVKFFQRETLSNGDALDWAPRPHFPRLRLRFAVHHFSAASLFAAFFSPRLATSQSFSLSARESTVKARPLSAASRSISRKRRANFALAFFNAISGSTCRNRARFTAANSKSPISSSTRAASFVPEALRSSAHSSRSFSKIPCALSQSKPAREAFRVNCKPSIVAGNVRGTPSSNDFGVSVFLAALYPCRSRAPCRSCALICSQFRRTSAASRARFSPKTCGCRRTIFSCTSRIW